ncbi:hypothetical protein M430DRAFT_32262 [Amorphotheca resinae ATCC 22711]|uniref:Uncharacterized protein n=1 Tax=Amorphotheca resinae ATCC 22711 TaxID=857342 RepID=A0A2T3BDU6_AMORE|nr:hypothetical protein M430DRAFT_32262 [Amorphotheca resinae ATCC 22711]PSS27579.1 hypothetical protein M430DRAFT_32262 [Amorphotheca resinae ATCC 22711]
MCDYEEFHYACGHVTSQLLSYCHFARCDPYHQCFGVKVTKQAWQRNATCPLCHDAAAASKRTYVKARH